jgi:U3 small nucleolar RNA-associated protein 14
LESALAQLPEIEVNEENEAMVRRAFADAGVVNEEFDEERRHELEGDDGTNEAEKKAQSLPGWGSWAGEGAKKPNSTTTKKPRTAPLPKIVQRSNVPGLSHVIVSTKQANKAAVAKYLVERVPYPFTSHEQYERALRTAVGPDWNTPSVFAKAIKPAVLVRRGAIVDPVSWKKNSTKKRSFE